jgi:hypothetical protein
MLASSGEATPSCGVPVSESAKPLCCSTMPARRNARLTSTSGRDAAPAHSGSDTNRWLPVRSEINV